jgi:hypothetical protein
MATSHKSVHKNDEIIIHQLNLRATDRGKKDIAAWRGALTNAESIYFPNRTRLYDLYEDVILDGHLSGLIAKRVDAVLNKEIYFEVAGTRLRQMDDLVHSLQFRGIMRAIMETQLRGHFRHRIHSRRHTRLRDHPPQTYKAGIGYHLF